MKTFTKLLLLLFISSFAVELHAQNLQSPAEFLGYELGDKFTRHHRIVDYFEHVAEANGNVSLMPYGTTNEGRPLMVAYVSSAENMAKLETIREDNLKRAGIIDGTPSTNVAIVWLSYNVHGNEASSSEATMQTLYAFANKSNAETQKWLENTVVIIDPCINPDGRDRYAQFINQYGNKSPDVSPDAREHNEPWPGGRVNHYLFDLNRDWAWQSQVESKQRMKLYNQWLPHVHVDFHEQGINSPYYFAPAAEPYHKSITGWQREFQHMIGKNHAKYFDNEGWLYFTKEVFDLLYPSYGDTYPMFNGAIGMTYEQAGHSRGGVQVLIENGDTLKLSDRIAHHYTTGLSTVEVASVNKDRLVNEFSGFFRTGANNTAYKSFIIKKGNNPDRIAALLEVLDNQGITYGTLSGGKRITGFDYQQNRSVQYTPQSGDVLVSTSQPKGLFASVLLEPRTVVPDSVTYDITAWSLPYLYGLDAVATTSALSAGAYSGGTARITAQLPAGAYAYVSATTLWKT